MKIDRRSCLTMLGGLLAAAALPVRAAGGVEVAGLRQPGRLRVAVYNNFPPYSQQEQGIDVDLARAIAAKLGLVAEIVGFNADEDMNDDLRNMVWKGHYLGRPPADLMMHVPVDAHLARANEQVRIIAPYCREMLAVARNPALVPPISGSAAVALEVFTREKIGVEVDTLADSFLLSALNGRLRDNVVHYRSIAQAAAGLSAGEVAAVMAPRAELEAAVGTAGRHVIGPVDMPELRVGSWPLGMAVKADNLQLAEAVGAALAALQQEGAVAGIFARHGISYRIPGG